MPMKQGAEEFSLVNVCKNIRWTVCPGSRAGLRVFFSPQCRVLMYPVILASFLHFCDLHYWMNLLISGSTKGPWRLQVDQRFYLLHATQMQTRNQFLHRKALFANLRIVLKGAKWPQWSWQSSGFPCWLSLFKFLLLPRTITQKKEKKKKKAEKKTEILFLCQDLQLSSSLLGDLHAQKSPSIHAVGAVSVRKANPGPQRGNVLTA